MVGVPMLVVGDFDLVPDVLLDRASRSRTGTGSAASARSTGSARRTTDQIAHDLPAVLAGGRAQPLWLVFLAFVATPFGLLLAYQLDKEIRGTRLYQSIFFLPVVLLARDHRLHLGAHLLADAGPDQQPLRGPAARPRDRLARQPASHQPVGRPRRGRLAARRLHHDPLPRRAEGASTRRCARPPRSTAPASGTPSGRSSSRR